MIDTILSQDQFKPLPRLRTKYLAQLLSVWAVLLLIPYIFMTFLYFLAEESGEALFRVALWMFGITAALVLVGAVFIIFYYATISYEILNDEVHVYRGVITRTRKIVPYRTITNLDVKQGPYDRIYGLGTIEIQTAGNSAQKMGPEERLDGLPAELVVDIQEILLNRVRKFRGSPATSHDLDGGEDILASILDEVKQLRAFLTSQ